MKLLRGYWRAAVSVPGRVITTVILALNAAVRLAAGQQVPAGVLSSAPAIFMIASLAADARKARVRRRQESR
jgi:hypothetical protein